MKITPTGQHFLQPRIERLTRLVRWLAASEQLSTETFGENVPAPGASHPVGWLLSAETLPTATSTRSPILGSRGFLRWLLSAETLPAAGSHPAAGLELLGLVRWLIKPEKLDQPPFTEGSMTQED